MASSRKGSLTESLRKESKLLQWAKSKSAKDSFDSKKILKKKINEGSRGEKAEVRVGFESQKRERDFYHVGKNTQKKALDQKIVATSGEGGKSAEERMFMNCIAVRAESYETDKTDGRVWPLRTLGRARY